MGEILSIIYLSLDTGEAMHFDISAFLLCLRLHLNSVNQTQLFFKS